MMQRSRWGMSAMVGMLCLGLAAVLSAQYQGWTIPDGGKDEKSPVKNAAAKTNHIAVRIVAGAMSPAATARRGPTRPAVSAPCTKS